uniref:Eukaryotic translation initiation factor 2 subunit 2 n=1 Tax=Rhinopithecus roxellana TaxID=61622 RepID=A0A2K6Q9U2_RHIRO
MIFYLTMSKKKKKKKPFMLDEEGDTQTEETQPSETKEVEPEPTEDKDLEADEGDTRKKDASDALDDLNFFNQKNMKKKTKKVFNIDEAEGVKDLKIESDVQEPTEPEDDLDIMLGNKKKKKKNVKFPDKDKILEKDEALEDEDSKKDDGISFSNQTGPTWAESRYGCWEEKEICHETSTGCPSRNQENFFCQRTDISKLLHRQPKHLLAFLLAELGTSGSVDGNNQLDTRLYFLQCETCHSRCSVASIKTGFQAATGKRAQLCAKAN